MKKHFKKIIGVVAAVSLVGIGIYATNHQSPLKTQDLSQETPSTNQGHIAPSQFYPDPALTPGKADTLNFDNLTKKYNGLTYSQSHRSVSSSEKKEVCKEYPDNCKAPKEIDHFIPLALGGSNEIANLWAEPETQIWNNENWGFHRKDILESYLILQMKAGKISPEDAQNCILRDWIACYKKNKL